VSSSFIQFLIFSISNNSAHNSQNGGLNAPHTVVNQSMPVILPISASGAPGVVAGPATNLNIGMDYWGTPTSSNIPAIRGKVVTSGSRDSVWSQLWLQVNLENRTMMFILFP
jgi:plant G-box-binding factor